MIYANRESPGQFCGVRFCFPEELTSKLGSEGQIGGSRAESGGGFSVQCELHMLLSAPERGTTRTQKPMTTSVGYSS